MADGTRSYQTGNLGDNAIVQQGENLYLYQITVQVQNEKDADALLRRLEAERGAGLRYDLLLRRLDPLVLVNRKEELKEIEQFFADLDARVLYVTGLPGIGKSTLVRGALEFRRADTRAQWIMCEGLDADQLLNEMNVGLHLEMHAVLKDTSARLAQRIAVVLGAIVQPSILVLDGFEALLDENGKYASQGVAAIMEALTQLEHKAKVLVSTCRVPPDMSEGSPGIRFLRLGGLSPAMAEELFRNRGQQNGSEIEAVLSRGALSKLDGHPKFIELLAAALVDLPVEQVVSGLLTALDIGEYVSNLHRGRGVALKTTKELIEEAKRLLKRGHYGEAVAAFDQAIHLDLNNAVAYFYKGWALYELNRYEEAVAVFDQAIHLDPNVAVFDKTISVFPDLDPGNISAHFEKGLALYDLKRHGEAVAAFDQAIHLDPNNVSAYREKGWALYKLEQHEEALTAFDQATRLNPNDDFAYLGKGLALNDLKRHEEAVAAFDQVIRIASSMATRASIDAAFSYRVHRNTSDAYRGKDKALHALKRYEDAH